MSVRARATQWARYLFFRADGDEMATLAWRVWLAPAVLATWLAGMGRHWDDPTAGTLQRIGVGSIVYVFLLAALLWAVIGPLQPRRWEYLQIATFVSLTAPPAFLYALPVERWMSMHGASVANAWFLALVASWRVALLVSILRRYARLTWPRTLVGTLLPLTAIVAGLFVLNLHRGVFQIMGGFREPTVNDGANTVLVFLTLGSFYGVIPLVIVYLGLALSARTEQDEA